MPAGFHWHCATSRKVPRVLGKYHFAQGAVSRISAAPLSYKPQQVSVGCEPTYLCSQGPSCLPLPTDRANRTMWRTCRRSKLSVLHSNLKIWAASTEVSFSNTRTENSISFFFFNGFTVVFSDPFTLSL